MAMHNLHDLTEQLLKAESEGELKNICLAFSECVNFEYYLYGICSFSSLSTPQIHCISNYPDDWIKRYFEEGFQNHDPVVKYCMENLAPVRWDQLVQMRQYVDSVGEVIMNDASKLGLVNGCSIPMKSPTGEVAIFSLATCNREDIDRRLLEVLPYAQLFASKLFEAYFKINQTLMEGKAFKLTDREVECLFWACEGKTAWEISKIIDVTERTIVFHLTSATKKLGAVNRQHAVAKALIHGLIKPTPYGLVKPAP